MASLLSSLLSALNTYSCLILRSQSATTVPHLYLQVCAALFMLVRHRTHLGCLDFVARTAAPPLEIWQHFTLLAVHAGTHLAPPLLCNYGGCASKTGEGTRRQSATTSTARAPFGTSVHFSQKYFKPLMRNIYTLPI